MVSQVQVQRTTTNNPPGTLPAGSFSVELGTDTRLWMGDGTANRLLTSTNPADVRRDADCVISATAPTVGSQTGVLWFDTVSGSLFLRFNDGTSVQWIQPATQPGPLALQVGPGLTLNNSSTPPTIDFQNNPYPQAITMNGALRVQTAGVVIGPAATATPGAGALTLNANTVAGPAATYAGGLRLSGADGQIAAAVVETYGSSPPVVAGRTTTGTATSPAGVAGGAVLLRVQGIGYTSAGAFSGSVYLDMQASETWSGTAQGSQMAFRTTPTGTTAQVNSLILAGNTATFSAPPGVNQAAVIIAAATTADALLYLQAAHSWGVSARASSVSAGEFNIIDYTLSAARLTISATGACAASSAWGVISDAAVKTDIVDHPRGLSDILKLQPRQFTYTGEHGLDGPGQGLIAQELEAVMPELVGEMATADGGTVKTVTETGIIWPLVNAIREIDARLKAGGL